MKRYTNRYSIGLTGGIGVGKTTITDHFAKLGVCIIDADEVSRAITEAGQPAVKKIAEVFGEQVLGEDETLDRQKLRKAIFDDLSKKQQLEQILHPLIREQMQAQANDADSDYVIFSIPLLIETGQIERFDRILVIDAPDEQRIKWIQKRSGLSIEEIKKIINSQTSRPERLAVADDVINNDKDLEYLYQQVESLHQKYLKLAQSTPKTI